MGRDGRGPWESREIPPVNDLITPCSIYQVFGNSQKAGVLGVRGTMPGTNKYAVSIF